MKQRRKYYKNKKNTRARYQNIITIKAHHTNLNFPLPVSVKSLFAPPNS